MNNIDIQYSKHRKNISLMGAFNACVVVPLRVLGGIATMCSVGGIIVNNALMDELPFDRLQRDLDSAQSKTSFKLEKTGLLGRGLTIKAERRHPYSPIKTVRYCDITFDSRAERNHYAQQIKGTKKTHSGLYLSAYTDIAASVLSGSLNLDMNPMMKRFDGQTKKKEGFLSRTFLGSVSDRHYKRLARQDRKNHNRMLREHRREMRRLGIKSVL